jgi:hypothetical protein
MGDVEIGGDGTIEVGGLHSESGDGLHDLGEIYGVHVIQGCQ